MEEYRTAGISGETARKGERLREYIAGLGSLAVGFSGGVDSSLLLAVASEVLGENCIAITQADAGMPARELAEAKEFCRVRGIRHILCAADPFREEEYRFNGAKRCYYCKRAIFREVLRIAGENGIRYVAEGSNMDDLGDYRPGLAAVEELKVVSPLREAGLTKEEIRLLSREMGLASWNKPAYACLATRLAAGDEITVEKLRMLDSAEQFLIDRGFARERVRIHRVGEKYLARIEVAPEDIGRIAAEEERGPICEAFGKLGFLYVTLDLKGYRTGSMNATIRDFQK